MPTLCSGLRSPDSSSRSASLYYLLVNCHSSWSELKPLSLKHSPPHGPSHAFQPQRSRTPTFPARDHGQPAPRRVVTPSFPASPHEWHGRFALLVVAAKGKIHNPPPQKKKKKTNQNPKKQTNKHTQREKEKKKKRRKQAGGKAWANTHRAVRGGGAGWSRTLPGWGGSRGSCPPYLGRRGSRRYGNAALRRPPGGWGQHHRSPAPAAGWKRVSRLPRELLRPKEREQGGGSRGASRPGHLPCQTGGSRGRCCSRRKKQRRARRLLARGAERRAAAAVSRGAKKMARGGSEADAAWDPGESWG